MKKICSVFLVLALTVTSLFVPSVSSESTGITPAMYVQSFIDVVEPDKNFTTGETVEIIDENDNLAGFCVSLLRNSHPSGYVVVRFDEQGPIVSEFVTECNVGNLYDEIAGKGDPVLKNSERKVLYGCGIDEYVIEQERNGREVFLDHTGQEFGLREFNNRKENTRLLKSQMQETRNATISTARVGEISNERSGIYTATSTPVYNSWDCIDDYYLGTFQDVVVITDFAAYEIFGEWDVVCNTNRYACNVAAMLNLVSYAGARHYTNAFYNSSPWQTFNLLWNLSGTTFSHTTTIYNPEDETHQQYRENVTIGVTTVGNVKSAIENYFNNYTSFDCTVDEFVLNKSFNVFVQNIDNDYPCMFDYIGASSNVGHSVFVKGYLLTSSDNYLVVDDGWYPYPRYLNFSGYSFTQKYGRAIRITA